jgi:NADH-quinone oxidoreductase subunit L
VYGSGHNSVLLYSVVLITALLTSFYMWRLMYLTFYGTPRGQNHAHEAPAVMTVPLYLLSFGAAFAGLLGVSFGMPGGPILAGLLQRLFGPEGQASAPQALFMTASTAAAIAGLFLGSRLYLRQWRGMIGMALAERFYVDHVLYAIFVRGLAIRGGRVLSKMDAFVIDGGVNGTAWMVRLAGAISRWWDTWIIDGLVRLAVWTVKLASYPMRLIQTGSVQLYALVFLGGLMAVVSLVVYSAR